VGLNYSPSPCSQPIIRLHTLTPNLFTSDLSTELTDTTRWQRLEAADVMAACDRNVVDNNTHLPIYDWRGDMTAAPSIADTDNPPHQSEGTTWPPRELSSKRSMNLTDSQATSPPASGTTTPYHPSQTPTSPPISPVDRAMSKQRNITPSGLPSPSSSRTSTPHMPANSHFANFQVLQWNSHQSAPSISSSMSPRRSGSRFRSPEASDPSTWSNVYDSNPPVGPSSLSRRSSNAPSLASTTGVSSANPLLSPEFRTLSLASDPRHASVSPGPGGGSGIGAINSQITKLETELVQLQGEVNFQTYLKQLHLQHMGTVHREKVLESGQEAERQSRVRTPLSLSLL